MKLKEYLNNLNKLVKNNPELLDYTVVYSKDDEGNGFNEIYYDATIGKFDEDEFLELGYDMEEYIIEEKDCNAICIN